MRLLTIVGARPQFIKAAAISRALKADRFAHVHEQILHTGQHYDSEMSGAFFQELEVPEPAWNLEAGQIKDSDHQLGAMTSGIKEIIRDWKPDCVLVYGDTNSTLAGALAAAGCGVHLAHVEAGLRSYRPAMPEEINRVLTDRLSGTLFCPTQQAVLNLKAEGRDADVHLTGDVMYDVFLRELNLLRTQGHSSIESPSGTFLLATIHRAENTNDPERLKCLADALSDAVSLAQVVLPLHPRTRRSLDQHGIRFSDDVKIIEPLPYRDLLSLLLKAAVVVTDSGGLQKEAYFAATPCVTLRDETEWTETVDSGWNRLAAPGAGSEAKAVILEAITSALHNKVETKPPPIYGDGNAAGKILDILASSA